jgi:hypothetical protein
LTQDAKAVLNPKKKYAERLLEKLRTNDNGEAAYEGVTMETSAGVLTAKTLKNVHIS